MRAAHGWQCLGATTISQIMRILYLIALTASLFAASGCGGSGGGNQAPVPPPAVQPVVSLEFLPSTGRDMIVRVRITTDSASAPDVNSISLASDYGTLGPLTQSNPAIQANNAFYFDAVLIPDVTDSTGDIWTGEIAVTSSYDNVSISRSALILADKLAGIGQAEVVPGLVNTRGVEDSPEVSADGQWLTVGTYIPIDFGHCIVKGRAAVEPACNQNFYDQSGVERPGLFGAERIIDDQTINHAIPQIGYDPAVGLLATPPTASFLFRRLDDGSYGEPTVLGLDTGGYTWQAPYGFTIDSITGSRARVFFSFNDLTDIPDSSTDVYVADIILGAENVLGEYQNGSWQTFSPVKVPIDPIPMCGVIDCEDGNPHITTERLWIDNERDSDDLFFLNVTRDITGAPTGYSLPMRVPLSQPQRGESMPFMDGDTLYYNCSTSVCRSQLVAAGADPELLASWQGEEEVLRGASTLPSLAKAGRAGRVVATTEPSIATISVDGEIQKWLFFGYLKQTHYGPNSDDFGADWSVARVRLDR